MHVTRRTIPAALVTTALAVVLAGCGAAGDGSGAAPAGPAELPAATADEALAAMVPEPVSADGTFVFGTDASYPPNEFTDSDGTTIIGMDVDLATAVAQKLGLEARFENSQFSGIIPGIQSARYEAGISSFTINDERVETVDMVSYFSAGTSLAVTSGNPQNISADALCGLAVGVQSGTVQAEDVVTRSEACVAAGQPEIAITELQAQTDVNLALTANRIVAMLVDSPVAAYAVSTTEGAVEVVGEPYDTAPYGIALGKGQGEFAAAVQGAMQALIDDGTYAEILEKWNVADGAIPASEVSS